MRVQLISDLHVEHQADHGQSFVDSLDASICDVLVLAGDIGMIECGLGETLEQFCRKFAEVVFCKGNHEHYSTTSNDLNRTLLHVQTRNANFHVLDRNVVVLGSQRFIGCTLWFPDTPMARKAASGWSDFEYIDGLDRWVYRENALDQAFLQREVQAGDIVVTHHLPSYLCVDPQFAGSAINCYFVNPMDELILERKPAYYFHGHTHASIKVTLGSTQILANPFGYAKLGMLNPRFQEDLVVNV